ncbi:MAG: hypothetical protein LH624_13795 [Cryobacterium sp.]|nr:hypothetical protein [Cryobacterium sp.]
MSTITPYSLSGTPSTMGPSTPSRVNSKTVTSTIGARTIPHRLRNTKPARLPTARL